MSKSQPVTQTTNTSTSIPGWLSGAAQTAATEGQNLPQYTPYTGPGPSGLTSPQLMAIEAAMRGNGQGQGIALGALPGLTNAMNFAAPQVTAGSLTPQIQGLLNPYTQNVVDATNRQIDYNTARDTSGLNNTLAMEHAFGGDRQAIADADLATQGNIAKTQTDANLYSGGYNNAEATALAAGQGNQGAVISGAANVNLPGSNAVAGLGSTITGLNNENLQGLLTAGGTQQQTQTAQNQFQLENYLRGFQIPDQQAQTLASILGSLPHDTTGASNTTGTVYTNGLLGAAGLGLGIAGLGTGGGATLGGSFLKGIFGV